MKKPKVIKEIVARVSTSEKILQKAAARLIPDCPVVVCPEVQYLQLVLGPSSTQVQIDEHVVAVRKIPWHAIAISDN